MKLKHYLLAWVIGIMALLVPITAMASDLTWAQYHGTITITNNSTSASVVSVNMSLNSASLISQGWVDSNFENCAIQNDTGADVPFMPGYGTNPWCLFTPSIGDFTTQYDVFYTGNSSLNSIKAYFPGTSGMTTTDSPTLQPGGNFTIQQRLYIDTSATHLAQNIVGGYYDTLNPAATEYNCLMGGYVWNATESAVYQVMPTGGTISQLYIRLDANVAGGTTYIFTLMVDSAPSSLVATVNGGASTGSDTAHSVAVTAGQTVSLRSTYTGAPGAPNATWTSLFTSALANESICMVSGTATLGGSAFTEIQGYGSFATEVGVQAPIPTNGTFKNLYVKLSADPGTSPDNYVFTLRKAAGNTSLTCTVTADDTAGHDTTHTVAVSAGDLVDILVGPADTPAVSPQCAISMVFASNTKGESLVMGGTSADPPSSVATEYNLSCTSSLVWNATEGVGYQLTQEAVFSKFYVVASTATSAGDSWTFSLNNNGAPTGMTVTLAAGTTAGNDLANHYNALTGTVMDLKSVPTGGPTNAPKIHTGLVSYSCPQPRLFYKSHAIYCYVSGTENITAVIPGVASVTAVGVPSGEHTVKVWADSIKLYIDIDSGAYTDEDPIGTGVPAPATNWTFCPCLGVPYLVSQNITIGGNPRQSISWEYAATFTDATGSGHDATPSFRTDSSDSHVSAVLTTFAPITLARAPAYTVSGAPFFITGNITTTSAFTTSNVSPTGPPGSAVVEDVAKAGGTPNIWIWGILGGFTIAMIGLFISWMERKYGGGGGTLILRIGVATFVMGLLVAFHKFDYWMVVMYLFIALAPAMASRHGEWGGNVGQLNLIGFLAMSWVGLTTINRILEGQMITSAETSYLNTLMFTQEFQLFGIFKIPVLNFQFFTEGIPRLVKWDYSFFGGNAQLFQYMLYSITAVVSFSIFIVIIGLLYNYFNRLK